VRGPQLLLALRGATALARSVPLERPVTPLSAAALLTNAPVPADEGAEQVDGLGSADSVDLLCAFVRWHGLRVLQEPLTRLRERDVPLRVITTTYVGAQVRVSYEAQSTRLHAKAWLMRRRSGFDTVFVGSSNLSRSALVDGPEWNVRLSAVATPALLRKFSYSCPDHSPGHASVDGRA
jgi:hypothetical protein